MVARSSSSKTPDRVIELLRSAVEASSQSAVARETDLRLYSIQRYLKGIGEPSQATLEKLARYFKTSVAYLRGESTSRRKNKHIDDLQHEETPVLIKMADDLINAYHIVPDGLKQTLMIFIVGLQEDIDEILHERVAGMEPENEEMIKACLTRLQPIVDIYEADCERAKDIGTNN